ncbi:MULTISPECIES: phage tail protein [unclassified Pseudoalteromonas]|uniref:phage tail protein n=1 Tax=unclassified Pseudoalteromonas TaxID=194690 RepID=UPI001F39EA30|nr:MULTISPECIES: phage tail protein [unclassified Pseudoalteromonas]MCF2827059.1 phage tail protein [Pseudoalteromonas sp. OF5H-5]MCF2832021.1 phage tail protein [Pseudoalteromonas sp. DL2-H6]MCF2925928.1 phage tail protein [Pseudoalteromonas sp. DL2-H1]
MRQMMSLGDFVFSLSEGTPYSGLQRSSDGGWVTVPRYGQKPISQNTGQQLEKISISGTWFRADGMANLDALRAMQLRREPLVLTDGYGRNLGLWTLKQLQEKQDRIIDDGTAIVIDFTIELEEYAGDSNTQS